MGDGGIFKPRSSIQGLRKRLLDEGLQAIFKDLLQHLGTGWEKFIIESWWKENGGWSAGEP